MIVVLIFAKVNNGFKVLPHSPFTVPNCVGSVCIGK